MFYAYVCWVCSRAKLQDLDLGLRVSEVLVCSDPGFLVRGTSFSLCVTLNIILHVFNIYSVLFFYGLGEAGRRTHQTQLNIVKNVWAGTGLSKSQLCYARLVHKLSQLR